MPSPTVTCCGDNFLSKTGGYLGSAELVRKTHNLSHMGRASPKWGAKDELHKDNSHNAFQEG